jgi:hypothetical protein
VAQADKVKTAAQPDLTQVRLKKAVREGVEVV